MSDTSTNPFSATRAADFTDEQIHQYWVDIADDGGFLNLVKPRSEMPMLILGGKGSGKTHILRYMSFQLQRLRHGSNLVKGISAEGYVGIYLRCSGLNSSRFRGKRQSREVWESVFAYYMEIWVAQIALEIFSEIYRSANEGKNAERTIIREASALADGNLFEGVTTIVEAVERLKAIQRELDLAINNCVFSGSLGIQILLTPGKLIYGLPKVFASSLESLSGSMFLYLLDECENLTDGQQKFLNTLIREKVPPSSFKIGSRLYGIKTKSTYCADEENKEGSEFETLLLDARLRSDEKKYSRFASDLVAKRLYQRGYPSFAGLKSGKSYEILKTAFEVLPTDELAESETSFVQQKYRSEERPYFKALISSLKHGIKANASPGVESEEQIEAVLSKLRYPRYPLLEKLNVFMFYQKWSSGENLVKAANTLNLDCNRFVGERPKEGAYWDRLQHFKYDLLAQLRRECDQKQVYSGWQTLLDLSWGNPRHLLIILKHVVSWSSFKGEQPFKDASISVAAQTAGVKDAADWFLKDARTTGKDGLLLHDAINRLGTLFRTIRYSDKPSECSLCTISFDMSTVSVETRRLVGIAEKWSLLVDLEGGQRDRNSERIDAKLQLNRMLCPLWDIPFYRRGVLPLSGNDVDSIFDPQSSDKFEENLRVREARMMAPFFGEKGARKVSQPSGQGLLPGMEE